MNYRELMQKKNVRPYVLMARFGLEKENQRSTREGLLATTDHPTVFGNRSYHPYIQTDFSETQLELITPVANSGTEMLRFLDAIHDVARRSIPEDEMLWPLSMPPQLPTKDEEIKIAKLDQYDAVLYRRYLAKEYGKRKQMVSGIHFNFEYDQALIQQLYDEQSEVTDCKQFKTKVYMKVARNFLRYRWLITYLFGASPVSEDGYFRVYDDQPQEPIRSIRNSTYGYRNHDNVKVSYASLERYLEDIHRMVENGLLSEEKEFYAPVRLRGGKQMSDLPKTGIRYIELRNLDLNPFSRLGIRKGKEVVGKYYQQLRNPQDTVSGKMWTIIQENSNSELGNIFGNQYQSMAFERPYQLAGFREMELSTQIFLFDAIQKGLEIEILDEQEQFLKLQHGEHIEYVKNANMTSKDNYVVPLIMENKTVTKKILSAAGFHVPGGEEFSSFIEAQEAHLRYANKAFVVKPKSTNYGLGITIFKEGASLEDFTEALRIAFKEDTAVLIEEFLPGTEYRFFVLDNDVKAIMLRVPANVTGDGKHTVEELVAAKNSDPLRGTNHRAPLELIQLNDLEKLMLKEQGLTIYSVPEKEQIVYLRENSNVSTGGDSIDMTDVIDDSYKQIAIEAVAALGAKICGIDLIIPDKDVKGTRDSLTYGIIEANFNPAMHMHVYPYAGQGRRLTMDVLKLLYPEVVQ